MSSPYLIGTPLSNEGVDAIFNFIQDLDLDPKCFRIYIDLQNITTGRYYNDNIQNIYVKFSESEVASMIIYELVNFISSKLQKFRNHNVNSVVFYLYSDESRNKLNEYFIPTWKTNRKKSWEQVKQTDPKLYESQQWISSVYKAAIKSSKELLGRCLHSKIIMLKYVDSDFVPQVFVDLDRLFGIDSLHVIVSNDHDYIHMVESNKNVVRYFFLTQHKNTVIEHKYNIYNRVSKKFNQKSLTIDDKKLISKFYQVFHAILGDPGDGFGNLISRKGVTYWYPKLKDILSGCRDIWDLRRIIFTKNILDLDKDLYLEFQKRFFVVDFYFFSIHTIKYLYPDKLTNVDKEFVNLTKFLLDFQSEEIFRKNSEIFKDVLISKEVLQRKQALQILDYFKVKNSSMLAESLWY